MSRQAGPEGQRDQALSPDQLHAVAAQLRTRWSPPQMQMPPGEYISHEAINALAWALDAVADEADDSGADIAPSGAGQ